MAPLTEVAIPSDAQPLPSAVLPAGGIALEYGGGVPGVPGPGDVLGLGLGEPPGDADGDPLAFGAPSERSP